MPKPFTTHPGSGMHTHVSLFEGDRNAFFEAGAEYQLSKTGRQFIAGHPARTPARSPCVTNQWVNSYKRLIGGGEAPSYICWGHNNRSAMVRVPMYKPNKGQSTRIELRTIDAACNPYLAFAVMLAAGMKGIEEDYELPREAEDDVWSLTERERKASASSRCPRACTRRSRSPRTPSCWPRRSASTSSTSSCATSAPSGTSTAPRSPPSSATGCCRSSERLRTAPAPVRAIGSSREHASALLVVEHEAECPPGWIGEWLAEAGSARRTPSVRRRQLPADLRGARRAGRARRRDGRQRRRRRPWLTDVKELIRDAVADGSPVLGICLGHQLVGGRARR